MSSRAGVNHITREKEVVSWSNGDELQTTGEWLFLVSTYSKTVMILIMHVCDALLQLVMFCVYSFLSVFNRSYSCVCYKFCSKTRTL